MRLQFVFARRAVVSAELNGQKRTFTYAASLRSPPPSAKVWATGLACPAVASREGGCRARHRFARRYFCRSYRSYKLRMSTAIAAAETPPGPLSSVIVRYCPFNLARQTGVGLTTAHGLPRFCRAFSPFIYKVCNTQGEAHFQRATPWAYILRSFQLLVLFQSSFFVG